MNKRLLLSFLIWLCSLGLVANGQTCSSLSSFPYTETFENDSPLKACWTVLDLNGDGKPDKRYLWNLDNTLAPHSGTQAAVLYTDAATSNNDWLITPQLMLSGNQQLSFWTRVQSATEPDQLEILLSTTGKNPADFTTTLLANTALTNTGYQLRTLDLSVYSGPVYIAFVRRLPPADGYRLYLDDVTVENKSTVCPAPTSLTANNITASSARLNWNQSGTAQSWQLEVLPASATPTGNPTHTTSSKPFTVTGLTQNTAYRYYVRAVCSGGTTSAWTGPYDFATPCGVLGSFPYTETFESDSPRKACWTVLDVNGDGTSDKRYSWNLDNTLAPHSGTQAAVLYTQKVTPTTNNDWLISPALALSGNQQLSFWSRVQDASQPDQLEVLLSTTGKNPADFTITLLPNTLLTNTAYQLRTLDLSAYSGTVYIAFVRRLPPVNGYRLYIDDVAFETKATCQTPANLTVGSITATSASLNWTQGGNVSGWQIEVQPAGTPLTSSPTYTTGSKPFALTGLSQNTAYQFAIRAVCSGGATSGWSPPLSFTTLCGLLSSFPYTESFENDSPLKACWTVLDLNGDGTPDKRYLWNLDNTLAPRSGTQAAVLYTDAATSNNDWLITPQLMLSGNQQLSFWTRVQSATEPDQLEILLSTTGKTPADFTTTLLANTSLTNTAYQLTSIDLGAYSGPVYIAFVRRLPPADGYRLYLDDVTIENKAACQAPTSLTTAGITASSAQLNWTQGGSVTGWQLEVLPASATPTGNPTHNTTARPFLISGLTQNTVYQYFVRAVCSGGTTSPWAGPFNFATPCGTLSSFPYTETFENDSPLKACWTVLDLNGDGTPDKRYLWNLDNTLAPRSGTQAAVLYTDAATSNNDWLITPQLMLSGNQQLRFWSRVQSATEPDQLEVLLSTTGKDPANFTTTLLTNTSLTNTTYQEYTLDLRAYSGPVYIAFVRRLPPADGYRLYIDDVTIENIAACPSPSNLTSANITASSAQLNWTQIGSPASWEIELLPASATPTGTPNYTTTNKPFSVSGLTQNVTYQYYVRAVCGSTTGAWIGPHIFSTPCGVLGSFPYTETFESDSPLKACWTVLDVNGDGQARQTV